LIPRSQLVMAMVAAFLFGISGGALGGFAVSTLMQRQHRGGPPPGHRIMRFQLGGPMTRDMARQLDLSPQQLERVHAILSASGERYAAVRESTRSAIERELTPKQREEFRRLEKRFVRHRRFEGRYERRFPPWQDRRIIIETDTIVGGDEP
jgi:hypothetical protein